MTNPNQYETKPLSVSDKKVLRKHLVSFLVFGVSVGAILLLIFNLVLLDGETGRAPVFIFSGLGLVFTALIFYFFRGTYLDLKHGIKYCTTGFVTDKRINKHTTSSASHNKGGAQPYASSRKNTQTHYYVCVENKEYSVTHAHYLQAQLGDLVYLEISPRKKEILAFTVLEKGKQPTKLPTDAQNDQDFASEQKSAAMPTEEVKLVKKMFYRGLRSKLIYLILVTILLVVLWPGIFIFMVPLILAFAYYTIAISIQLYRYAKFYRNGCVKTITKISVVDKRKTTSNRNATKYQLESSNGPISVTEAVYNQIQESQILYLHQASGLNILYQVSFNGQSFSLLKK